MNVIRAWYERNFSDPQAVILALFLISGFVIIIFWGGMLAPLLVSVVIAYLLEAIVLSLEKKGMSRIPSVLIVFIVFVFAFLLLILMLIPVLSGQVAQLMQELPRQIDDGQQLLMRLPEMYPQLISEDQVKDVMSTLRRELTELGQTLLSISISSIPGLIALAVLL